MFHRKNKPDKDQPPKQTHTNKKQNSIAEKHGLLQLQSQLGNQAVQRLLAEGKLNIAGGTVQAKMTVGAADDHYEQEADAVAKEVMTMPDPVQREEAPGDEDMIQSKRVQREETPFEEDEAPIQAKLADTISRMETSPEEEELAQAKRVQREESPMEEDEIPIQAKAEATVPDVTTDMESNIEQMRGSGQALPQETRDYLEPRFGADFSNVNVHTGAQADTLNQQLNARAFTTGSDIFFREGEYNPGSSDGQELLAHELTHVVQQGSAQTKQDDSAEGG